MAVDSNNDILTIEQTAELLKVGNRTVYNLLSDERIPGKIFAKKVGRSWRILRSEIERFLSEEKGSACQMSINQANKK
ncbi:MAG: helix-turn-helix domain-containing protein [Actinobacteria bacterium]|nr:helix-turn-helix domain-containing protein [Actinomycetota bacterium]